ncbi:MAG TPA: hypothetical protein ENH25_01470 [candidate division Zixibacteria bacterium]|nr:hypothetical protein [candidate division Zixibacteria bacterium]
MTFTKSNLMLVFIGGILLILIMSSGAMAQKPLSQNFISINAGTGYLPMSDWRDFAEGTGQSYFHVDDYGTYLDARLTLFLSFKHALTLNIESIKTFATANSIFVPIANNGDTFGMVIEWHYRSMPIGLSYEYYPRGNDRVVLPYMGGGVSYYFSKVKAQLNELGDSGYDIDACSEREEKGYGLHVYAGFKAMFHNRFYFESRLRARYADGSGFTDESGDVEIEFTGVDLTAGVAWRF